MSYVYLASPYTDPDEKVREERYLAAVRYVGMQASKGVTVLSPIVLFHEAAKCCDLPKDFAFWDKHCFALLCGASSLTVLQLPGWQESRGVRQEIVWALEISLPIDSTPC